MSFRTVRPSDMCGSRAAKAYLRQIRRKIPCAPSSMGAFLRQLEDEVFLYCGEHEKADFAALASHFGTPEEVANDFRSELGVNAEMWHRFAKQRVLYGAAILILAGIALTAVLKSLTHSRAREDDYFVEAITYEGEGNSAPAYWVYTDNGEETIYWEYDDQENVWEKTPVPAS